MIDINTLKPLLDDAVLKTSVDHSQVKIFNAIFVEDFITSPFEVGGKKIRIDLRTPKPKEYAAYSESFFHIITRKSDYYNERLYECNRANRIHWIKPILLSHPCKDIKYYKWKDEQGVCKEHFWFLSKKFMVVLKSISADLQIVTAFCVDDDEKLKYYERFKAYEDGEATC